MNARKSPRALGSLIALCSLASFARADVLRVADDGSQPYVLIQAAIDAASDRDMILVSPGQYAGFLIDNKQLAVVAADDLPVNVTGSVRVINLALQRSVRLDGLTIVGVASFTAMGHGLDADNNQGALRVQGCSLTGDAQGAFSSASPAHGADLFLCGNVIFNDCQFLGGGGSQPRAGNGLFAEASRICIFNGILRGQHGETGDAVGGRGGRGLRLNTASQAYIFDSTIQGGDGGDATNPTYSAGGQGGSACMAKIGTGLFHGNTLFVPAAGGTSASSPLLGQGGTTTLGDGNYVAFTTQAARRISGPSRVQGGADLGVLIEGQPGDKVFLYFSDEPYLALHQGFESAWAVNPGSKRSFTPIAVIPETGSVHVDLPTWLLGPLTDSSTLTFQARIKALDGSVTLSSPLIVHQLQCGFSNDCNGNGVPDACDIQAGTSTDCDSDGIPDSCGYGDFSDDCNGNGVPDTCELASGSLADCNGDLVPDDCQADCNSNGIADACDLSSGFSQDCDGDLVPDECGIDCNNNGLPDLCDISLGNSFDQNGNGVPDECQIPGTTYYVDDDAGPGGTGTMNAPFQSIGFAIDYALSGDTVLVFDGHYTGPANRAMDFGVRTLVVSSLNGPANCVIDLEHQDRAFLISGTQEINTRLEGFTIQRGFALAESIAIRGGSAVLVRNASPTIFNCIFEDCIAGSPTFEGSGAVAIYGNQDPGAGALIEDCAFLRCSGTRAGAIDAADLHGEGLTLLNTVIRDSQTTFGGAAIHSFNAELTLEGCELTGGTSQGVSGGTGIFHSWNGKNITLRNTIMRNNYAGGQSVLWTSLAGEVLIENCTIVENYGTAVYLVRNERNTITHSIFANNTAAVSPSFTGVHVAALNFFNGTDAPPTSVDNCLFFGNESLSASGNNVGAAVWVQTADDVTFSNCSFFLNTSDSGGALGFSDPSGFGTSGPTIRNSLFWENYGGANVEHVIVNDMALDYDYNNGQGGLAGLLVGNNASILYGANNSEFYPGFVDPDGADNDITTWEDNDVRLSPNSAARDAGDNTAVPLDTHDLDGDGNTTEPVPVDLAGVARQVDSNQPDTGNGPAPIVDLGCYEDQ